MIRVLHVLHGFGNGGVESFIMNMYRNINRKKVQFDFLIRTEPKNLDMKKEIEELGGKIFLTSEFPRNIIKNWKELNEFFKSNTQYKIIHVHANSLMYTLPIKISKKYNIKTRIMHSHNIRTVNDNKLFELIHKINRMKISKYTTNNFACSNVAGKWMFKESRFELINNAIDVEKFGFDNNIRNRIRKKLNFENKFVIGCIARLSKQKNHEFLIKIFFEILKQKKNAVLVIVGDGELEYNLKNQVKNLNIEKNVIFLGACKNIQELIQSFDIFCMPSLYEGLGISLIEAQASGLRCFTSKNVVPSDVNITGLISFISLEETAQNWANQILVSQKYERSISKKDVLIKKGYDIKNQAEKLEKFYLTR